MITIFGFGSEKESFHRVLALFQHPAAFLKRNKDHPENLADVLAFNLRLGALLSYIPDVLFRGHQPYFEYLILFILFARLFGIFVMYIGTYVLNFFVQWFYDKNSLAAAARVITFSSVPLIIAGIPFFGWLSAILSIIIQIVGVSAQYKLSRIKATILVLTVTAFFAMLIILTYYDFFAPL